MRSFLFGCALLAGLPLAAQELAKPAFRLAPEWGLQFGFGSMAHVNSGHSNERGLFFVPSASVRLIGRLEYVMEGHIARYLTPEGYMIGLVPVGARYSFGSGTSKPYLSAGAGFGWTDLLQIDEIDRRFNYILQASAGIRTAVSERKAWTVELRWNHISNAGTSGTNIGLNTLALLIGWRFR